ncbi:23S rRNA (guanosine(2251)-2'-O)-methyltransferase RlmB [Candidatus Kaiserbacteria bacterium]|nr:23S rRNA (guanosine(2251)-2'-O)-methyltransferase RlmB [Candidatus Kaiserbacteria bacterium]
MQKGKPQKVFIYGKHALAEVLTHVPTAVRKVHLASSFDDERIRALIRDSGVPISALKEGALREVESGASHQGVVAEISLEGLVRSYDSFATGLKPNPDTLLVILDELTDPHNVGAIIRSAAAFGAAGVLIPPHNQASITGAVVKVSAGMAFRVPLVQIGNVNQTVRDLKERGFWIYGLAGGGAQPILGETFTVPTVLIIGNEASGIRQKTRELCDVLLSIPIAPRCESLNAASAASVALYAWSAKHPAALA